MDLKRLFQVLVVGGQMVSCSATRPGKAVRGDGSAETDGEVVDSAVETAVDSAVDSAVEASNDVPPAGTDLALDEATDVGAAADVVTMDEGSAVDARATDLAQELSPADAISTPDAAAKDSARLLPCFCNQTPTCCEVHSDGTKGAVAGVECCWATSC